MSSLTEDIPNIRFIGFCGADDSVAPGLMQLFSSKYNWIEWGIIFGSDEGKYASKSWLNELVRINRAHGSNMHLAAHLCQKICHQVLAGDSSFVKELAGHGFSRVQVNATTAISNITNADLHGEFALNLRAVMEEVPGVEFIFQLNPTTQPVFDSIACDPPVNMSVLFDASCGLGVEIVSLPQAVGSVRSGYAGGIGPKNIRKILEMIEALPITADYQGTGGVWVDMESSLRVTNSDEQTGMRVNSFSIDKCFACVNECVSAGMPVVPL